jgi:phenylacetic acid degradation operon negative regulatory protein
MRTDPFARAVATLRGIGGQRVWSLMVSLFGDLARGEGERIPGPVLSSIMATMDVRPEAARVALHRLRIDGWITSVKEGRISLHSLTPMGRSESAAASLRIYATRDDLPREWQVAILPETAQMTPSALVARGFVMLFPRTFIGPADARAPDDALCLAGDAVPNWVRADIAPLNLSGEYQTLHDALSDIITDLPRADDLSALQVAALRCLIVHNWRRLVLRHPALPRALVDEDWPGHLCHGQVADLLAQYPRPALSEIAAG